MKNKTQTDSTTERVRTIGINILKHRIRVKMTIEEMAEHLNLSVSYIGLLQRGQRCPSLALVFRLCDLFGIKPNDLLMFEVNNQEDLLHEETRLLEMAVMSLVKGLNSGEMEFLIDTIKGLRKLDNSTGLRSL